MDLSFQLYSSRNTPSQEAFLSALAGLGYTRVEGFGGVYADPAGFRAAMDECGLTMPSGHFGVTDLETRFDHCVETATTLGMKTIFAPYLAPEDRPKDRVGYTTFAERLGAIGEKVTSAGFGFGWHNHDFELVPLDDDSVPLDVILSTAPTIGWEADLAWVIRGGADASDWVARYGDRILAVHVKDLAPAGENLDEDGWADVGTGVVDWASLVAQCRQAAPEALMIVEHDNPSDIMRFARTSIATLSVL